MHLSIVGKEAIKKAAEDQERGNTYHLIQRDVFVAEMRMQSHNGRQKGAHYTIEM